MYVQLLIMEMSYVWSLVHLSWIEPFFFLSVHFFSLVGWNTESGVKTQSPFLSIYITTKKRYACISLNLNQSSLENSSNCWFFPAIEKLELGVPADLEDANRPDHHNIDHLADVPDEQYVYGHAYVNFSLIRLYNFFCSFSRKSII